MSSASAGSALTIAGSLSETVADTSLSVSGGGALILSGTDHYTGGTTVNAAALAVTSSSALPSSGLMKIGSGGRLVLGGGAGIGALLGASSPISSGAIALERGGGGFADDREPLGKHGDARRRCSGVTARWRRQRRRRFRCGCARAGDDCPAHRRRCGGGGRAAEAKVMSHSRKEAAR